MTFDLARGGPCVCSCFSLTGWCGWKWPQSVLRLLHACLSKEQQLKLHPEAGVGWVAVTHLATVQKSDRPS